MILQDYDPLLDHLIFKGKRLEDHNTLRECGIKNKNKFNIYAHHSTLGREMHHRFHETSSRGGTVDVFPEEHVRTMRVTVVSSAAELIAEVNKLDRVGLG